MPYPYHHLFTSLVKVILVCLAVGIMVACSSTAVIGISSDDQQDTLAKQPVQITGIIVDSDAATPLYGATVAILGGSIVRQNASNNVAPDHCASPAKSYSSYACTREDGSFTLDLSNTPDFPLTVSIDQSGRHHEFKVTRDSLERDLGTIVFPETTTAEKEKVAVVMDFYNPIEEIQELLQDNPAQLHNVKLQLMNEYQSLYEISNDNNEVSYPTFYSLFVDNDKDGKADILNYDVVYINSRSQSDIAQLDKSLRKQLLNFVNNGGELIVTEWTVELQQEESTPDQYI